MLLQTPDGIIVAFSQLAQLDHDLSKLPEYLQIRTLCVYELILYIGICKVPKYRN